MEFISGSRVAKDQEKDHQRNGWMDSVEEDLGRASVSEFVKTPQKDRTTLGDIVGTVGELVAASVGVTFSQISWSYGTFPRLLAALLPMLQLVTHTMYNIQTA